MKSSKIFLFLLTFLVLPGCLSYRHSLGEEKMNLLPLPLVPTLRPTIGMHTGSISKVVADSEGQYLITGSMDKSVIVWKRDTLQPVHILHPPIGEGNEGKIYAVAINPNGKAAAAGGWTGIGWEGTACVYVFDPKSGRLQHRITGLPNVVLHLAYSFLGNYLVVCLGGNNGIYVYNTMDYSLVEQDRYYGGAVVSADFNAAERLVTASSDGFIRLYDKNFLLIAKKQLEQGKRPHTVSFSPDGLQIAVGFMDTAQVAVLSGQNLIPQFFPSTQGIAQDGFPCVCWGVDGSLYAAGKHFDPKSRKKIVRCWPAKERNRFTDILASSEEICCLSPLPDGSIAFVSDDPALGIVYGEESNIKISQVLDYRFLKTIKVSPDGAVIEFPYGDKGNPAYFSLISLARGGQGLLFIQPQGVDQKPVPLYSTERRNPKDYPDLLSSLTKYEQLHSLTSIPDKKHFIAGTDLFLRVWDSTGIELWKIPVEFPAWHVHVSENGKILVAVLGDGTIRWYDIEKGRELLTFFIHKSNKEWAAWTPSNSVPSQEETQAYYYAASLHGDSLIRQITNKSVETFAEQMTLPPGAHDPKKVAKQLNIEAPSSSDSLQAHISAPIKTAAPKKEDRKANLYILAIGVSEYKKPQLMLEFPAKDAQDFAQAVQERAGTLYERVQIKLLADQNANRMEIWKGMEWLVENAKPEDTSMLFLAGHGMNDASGYYYFLPVDADLSNKNLAAIAVPFSKIQKYVASIPGRVLFFLDTCHSGILAGQSQTSFDSLFEKAMQEKNEFVFFASSTSGQVSLENTQWGNGAFTKALVEGIQGKADLLNKGRVTVYGLAHYISERVKDLTREIQQEQNPTIAIPNSMPDFTILGNSQ